MPTFVLMTRLTADAIRDAQGRKAAGKEWIRRVRELCPDVVWKAHYAILGPYDFMDIYEAPDAETAHKVSLISRSGGAIVAESWLAEPYDGFLKLLEQVQS
ncbi:GYD domain-containing protein [Candidatus Fermentibacterales bacterium]|nr:GYD domain-containing protein [Candidatus Fermentibacterales bacterium]